MRHGRVVIWQVPAARRKDWREHERGGSVMRMDVVRVCGVFFIDVDRTR